MGVVYGYEDNEDFKGCQPPLPSKAFHKADWSTESLLAWRMELLGRIRVILRDVERFNAEYADILAAEAASAAALLARVSQEVLCRWRVAQVQATERKIARLSRRAA